MADPRVDVTVGANVQPFTAGINAAMASLRGFLTVAAFTALARSAVQLGSSLSDVAAANQVNVKWLQEVGFAATQSGSSLDQLANSIVELRRSQAQALAGSKTDIAAFRELGLSVGELSRMGAETIFDRIAEAVRKSGGGVREVNAAIEILGRGGKSLVTGMVEGFQDMRDKAKELGVILSKETVQAMDSMGDAWDAFKLRSVAGMAVILANISNLDRLKGFASGLMGYMRASGLARRGGASFKESHAAGLKGYEDYWDREMGYSYDREADPGGSVAPRISLESKSQSRERTASREIATDVLKRIGGYVGGMGGSSSNRLLTVQTSALDQLRAMRRELTKMANRRSQSLMEI